MRKLNHQSEYSPLSVVEGGEVFLVDFSPRTRYIAVYGTLRLGKGNWRWHLRDTSKYITTVKMPGIVRLGGLAACWIGKEQKAPEWCTMDIFEIPDENLEKVHRGLDILEGGYDQVIFPFEINGEVHPVKFYHIPSRITVWNEEAFKQLSAQDYVKSSFTVGAFDVIDYLKACGLNRENTPNIDNFISFYEDNKENNSKHQESKGVYEKPVV